MKKTPNRIKKPDKSKAEKPPKVASEERYAYSLRELMSNISNYVEKAKTCRKVLSHKLSQYAKITAECELYKGTKTLMKFSKIRSELNRLIKELYVTLDKIIESQFLLNKLYYECKASASRTFTRIISTLNKTEINALKIFLKPDFSDAYDYDDEIEKINNQYDSLVKRYIQDLKEESVNI